MPSVNLAVAVIVTASLLLMLMRPRGIAEVWWVCGGAAILVVTQLVSWPTALHAVGDGIDVYLFLAGMMLLSELARREGSSALVGERGGRGRRGARAAASLRPSTPSGQG